MLTTSGNNQRIAKNTLMLYIRMSLIMLVTLYTSRVVLEVLGVEDFGIYSVVGGVVTMLGFINSSLSGATSRFITYELGCGEKDNLQKVFRCSVTVHYFLAALIFILGETLGLWFVIDKMVIPLERMTAALWVYQCSIISIVIMIISSPYNALIIAHERMSAFAYISIFEVFAKLLIVYILMAITYDKLIIYAVSLLVIQLIIRLVYTIYCTRNFPEVSTRYLWDKELSFKILTYAGWTMNGNLAVVGYTQGINILLNLFFGPIVNAARGIAVQIQSAVSQFSLNFQMALRPPVIKSYACGDLTYMHQLLIGHAKYSFFLVLLIVMPLLINTEYVLQLWLTQVPAHTIAFTRLMLLTVLYCSLNGHVIQAIHATGNIKRFQLIEGISLLTVIPIAYLLLKFIHISAESVFVVYLSIEFVTQFVRVWIVYPCIKLSRKKYLTEICTPILKTILPLSIIGFCLWKYFSVESFFQLVISFLICLICTITSIFILGIKPLEKEYIKQVVRKVIQQINNK